MSGTISTGIRYGATLPELVPEIEEREAAVFAGWTWDEWRALPRIDRIDTVAHHRLHSLIETHRGDALAGEQKRRASRSRRATNSPPSRGRATVRRGSGRR